jgi:hypothetical protein
MDRDTFENMNAQAIRQSNQRWAQTRSRGRQRYVWVQGVLGWGGLLAVALCIGQIIAGRFHPVVALATTALCAVGGYLIGIVKWKHNEQAYRTGREEEIA